MLIPLLWFHRADLVVTAAAGISWISTARNHDTLTQAPPRQRGQRRGPADVLSVCNRCELWARQVVTWSVRCYYTGVKLLPPSQGSPPPSSPLRDPTPGQRPTKDNAEKSFAAAAQREHRCRLLLGHGHGARPPHLGRTPPLPSPRSGSSQHLAAKRPPLRHSTPLRSAAAAPCLIYPPPF